MKVACQKKKWQQNFIEIDIFKPNKKKTKDGDLKRLNYLKIEKLETI